MNHRLPQTSRSEEILAERTHKLYSRTDRLFGVLFLLQWAAAIIAAAVISPLTWSGPMSSVHLHLWSSVVLGGLLASAPMILILTRPGKLETRIVISVAQACFSGLLIHLSGGRIETHFHIFGSLAFLAFYRDWRVLVPATLVVAADHLLRGLLWPESVFGVMTPSLWRALEHAGWVVFEDVFLVWSCVASSREMRNVSAAQAELEGVKEKIEQEVQDRTQELQLRTDELEKSIENEKTMESQLQQAQKLEAVGQLAAGVAHEINTPMQFVNDNMEFLKDSTHGLFEVIAVYEEMLDMKHPELKWAERRKQIDDIMGQYHFEMMREQVPMAIDESIEGVQRVVTIVRAMKEFSHPGTSEKVLTDINQALRSTVTISNNRWKYAADLDMELDANLPQVNALPAELNQVFLNLVVNAGDAIAEKLGENSGEKGLITIRTYSSADYLIIEVADTGCGISEENCQRVFEPFFTTKDVGKGTGQGLSISYDVIVNRHQGKLEVESTPGKGTAFSVYLPLMHHERELAPSSGPSDEELLTSV